MSKIVLCGRRNTFTTFSEDALQFSWQAQHFGRVQRHFAWEGHTLEMGHKVTNIFILSFCVAGAILLRRFQKMRCSFRGRRSTLDVSIVIWRGRRSTLDVSCCVFFATRNVRAASGGDKVRIPW